MTSCQPFNIDAAHSSWHLCIKQALAAMDPHYLNELYCSHNWLPGQQNIFNAFSLPVNKTNYVFFGESPYPRATSANGYAFWDAAVKELWSETGLSKSVNRATSLRNILKTLLIAEGMLTPNHTTQLDISNLNKHPLIKTNQELFQHFLEHGFLLLNATLVLRTTQVRKDALAWQPFIQHILHFLFQQRPKIQLILLGNIAKTIDKLIIDDIKRFYAEHPYNISFMHNSKIIDFFRPLHLLQKC
ncbi:MAG: Uracil DNA glycosylase [uncultured bacterium]|nr:MAG: Uracil DNA glycosylase [uncultured bacterium]